MRHIAAVHCSLMLFYFSSRTYIPRSNRGPYLSRDASPTAETHRSSIRQGEVRSCCSCFCGSRGHDWVCALGMRWNIAATSAAGLNLDALPLSTREFLRSGIKAAVKKLSCITIFIAIGAADDVVCRLQNVFLNATRKRDNESVSRRPCLFRFQVPNCLSSDTVVVYIPQLFWANFKSSSKILVASYDAYRRLFQFQHNPKFRVKLFRIAFGAPRPSLSDRVCGIGMRVYPTDR